MIHRTITCTTKDASGQISQVGGGGFQVTEDTAIGHIEAGTHAYFTEANGQRAEVKVVTINEVKHLRSASDATTANNLLNLPNC